MKSNLWKTIFLWCALWLNSSWAAYSEQEHQGVRYGIIAAQAEQVRFYWRNEEDEPFRYLSRLRKHLEKKQHKIIMLMNAGIYDLEERPAGLWIEEGKRLKALNTQKGTGNFHLQPNGVFLIQKQGAMILSTAEYQKQQPEALWAVQSGPMLLLRGKINPRFKASNSSFYKRNAVCTRRDGSLLFVMTVATADRYPNLYAFSDALRQMGCWQALYLDGSISDWYVPQHYSDFHWSPFAGMIAVLEN